VVQLETGLGRLPYDASVRAPVGIEMVKCYVHRWLDCQSVSVYLRRFWSVNARGFGGVFRPRSSGVAVRTGRLQMVKHAAGAGAIDKMKGDATK